MSRGEIRRRPQSPLHLVACKECGCSEGSFDSYLVLLEIRLQIEVEVEYYTLHKFYPQLG